MRRRDEGVLRYIETVLPPDLQEEARSGRPVAQGMAESTDAEARPSATAKQAERADKGLQKLLAGREPSPDELFAVEAIILPHERPVIDVVGNTYGEVPAPFLHLSEAGVRDRLSPLLRSIGRIELPNHPQLPYGGTGFVVGERLLMTNRHVAAIFASGIGIEGVRFRDGLEAGVDFLRERNSAETAFLEVGRVAMVHPYWDMALLEVNGLGDRMPLSLMVDGITEGSDVVVVGYPAFDSRNDIDVQNSVFGGVFNIKRLQPGKLGNRRRVMSFRRSVDAVTHDSSTLGGNSGSAVIDVQSGSIVALHFAGRYLEANYAVPSPELARDGRVIDAGVSFAGAVQRGPTSWDESWRQADPPPRETRTDDASTANADQGSTAFAAAAEAGTQSVDGSAIRLTVPVTIEVKIGTPSLVSGAGTVGSALGFAGSESAGRGTVTFIHGIGNKPPERELLQSWKNALAANGGVDLDRLGVASSMVYWADVLYESPSVREGMESIAAEEGAVELPDPASPEEAAWLASTAMTLSQGALRVRGHELVATDEAAGGMADDGAVGTEAFPFPRFVERLFMKRFLRDVHHYLFDEDHSPRPGVRYRVRREIRKRFVDALTRATQGPGPHLVVAHSMGTVVAYDCLKRVGNCPAVDAFVTIGSPLGLSEVQRELRPEYTARNGYPSQRLRRGWTNIADPLDLVAALDSKIAADFRRDGTPVISDRKVRNDGPLNHSLVHYFATSRLRDAVANELAGVA